MRTITNALVAVFAVTAIASAAPKILLETTITRADEKGAKEILTGPRILVESGKQGEVAIGDLIKYAITPTLLADGTVSLDIRLLSARRGARKIAPLEVETQPGFNNSAWLGEWHFATKTSVVK